MNTLSARGLYRPEFEHDACGVGFVADISGRKNHRIVQGAVQALANLTHRGAMDADAKTGDGAGVLTQIPEKLFAREAEGLQFRLPEGDGLAVGMIFLPRWDAVANDRCRIVIEEAIDHYDLVLVGWRPVPVDESVLGDKAAEMKPDIQQVLVQRGEGMSDAEFERGLYLVRRQIERSVRRHGIEDCYICSFSNRTIVYKGMMVAPQVSRFYKDLQDPDFEAAFAIFHQRYSTNTMPNWFMAQPFRCLAHNGEINTLRGNVNWMQARESELQSKAWGRYISRIRPIVDPAGSDSAKLDNVFEAINVAGRDPLHAMMMLIPEAHQNVPDMPSDLRGFYEYHDCLMEPWDGPAAVVFSDGAVVGATLDRNGLRPARYTITNDDLIIMGSEVGMLHIDDRRVVEKGRLGPGEMIAVDTLRGVLLKNGEIKKEVSRRRPYAHWARENLIHLDRADAAVEPLPISTEDGSTLKQRQTTFGYTADEIEYVLIPIANDGKEPVGSMGDDTPLAMLSERSQLLYNFFTQRFAQVTNPPIDPLREELVMSLDMLLGYRRNMFKERAKHARLIQIKSPVLFTSELNQLRAMRLPEFGAETLPALFNPADGPDGLRRGLDRLCDQAARAVEEGKTLLILSDRAVARARAPIPMLLAVGAVHHHLVREGKRMQVSLLVESGEPREVHHFAALIGYGASAVNPYLAFENLHHLVRKEKLEEAVTYQKALDNYRKGLEAGILKVICKMGISTLSSYHGAQVFDAIGLKQDLISRYFTGTVSQVGGIGLEEIAQDVLDRHQEAFRIDSDSELKDAGIYRFRRDGEYHAFNPKVFKAIHALAKSGKPQDFMEYARLVEGRPPSTLRDLMAFRESTPIPLDEVEPVESICRRFTTAAMSHGSLSKEAHETLAIAMNRIGGKSNSGEGGEDPTRYRRLPNGDWANSAIKQVASGRFGVTPEYLASAREIEIKMAQGSKPGEGGQLPGHKVSAEIASIRHSVSGVTLISPPPHHDIYSIEDLAQLIYDLKRINTRAKICVKLVSVAGVGTIAAGVVKGFADVIHLSGHDGGTGASPLGAIKHSGSPWELGLSEIQQTLVHNDLRGRVTLRADGGFKTGRDVIIAAILGAEEFGFGTAALVAEGCVMARQCHLNTCPVGVATQKPELRKRFTGTPEMVVHFFTSLAEQIREMLAKLGYRSLEGLIGRTELLEARIDPERPRWRGIDLDGILADPDPGGTRPRYHTRERNDRPDAPIDDLLLQDAMDAIKENSSITLRYDIQNTRRAVGTKLAGEIAFHYGDKGMDGVIECRFQGSAGQSFGAFCIRGLRLILIGEANDYVGKGMHGGEIVVMPSGHARFQSHKNVIVGNTVMYGATGGTLYAAGCAGERFCVRNSGGHAVVEGLGDHGCEYMTGGVVTILGETGRNFGAGMTGGVAYVLDEDRVFERRFNSQLVGVQRVMDAEDISLLQKMIGRHLEYTNSRRASEVITRWEHYLPLFWKVAPHAPEEEDELVIPQRYQEIHRQTHKRKVQEERAKVQEAREGK
ncbi:MAG: glutamate synthase large subunit [bacterium]|nr:glutamate synthase large subunit [bacterium]